MIIENKLEALFQKDQLNNQMESGESFPYYEEYGINFKPTYKFNPGEDTYDLSEKMRIPAWCDRIVKRGPMKQLNYGSNYDIRFSDHRPVYGLFNAEVIVINQKVKRSLANELYVKRKAKFGNENYILSKNLSQMIKIDTEDGENSLPPPSTDKLKWWFNNGQLATVDLFTNVANIREMDIKENSNPNGEFEYREGMYINENRPENPFVFTEELDFIYPQD